jgi:hypothetical protein
MTSKNAAMKKAVLVLLAIAVAGAGLVARAAEDDRILFPKPSSHTGRWLEYHGKTVGAEGNSPGKPGKQCVLCHDRTDCIACHTTVAPRDHNNAWRMRGHGLMAGGNRDRCLACHKQDYCVRCHSETAPRSHTASWRKRHCTWCHFGSGDSITGNCTVCHKQRATHVPPPHAVTPSMDCGLCHT